MHTTLKQKAAVVLLALVVLVFLYPLIWLVFASLKPTEEIFRSTSLFPSHFVWRSYIDGWNGIGQFTFGTFFTNTLTLTIPTVLFTIVSSFFVAYGFARFQFPLRKIWFSFMMATLMLPDAIVIIPRYMLYRNLHWLDSYMPFYAPALLAVNAFFVFMLIQFFRGITRELDEAALIDGCNSFGILLRVLFPLFQPALFSAGIFQFIWTWNEFFNSLIFINSTSKYTLSLGLRMSLDAEGIVNWNQVLAMAVLAIVPCIFVFYAAQRYFVEGIATTGLKG